MRPVIAMHEPYIDTPNGRRRYVSPGEPWFDWSGWELTEAGDLVNGHHIRSHGRQTAVTIEQANASTVRAIPTEGGTPMVMWKGCLVWTYTGRA